MVDAQILNLFLMQQCVKQVIITSYKKYRETIFNLIRNLKT